MKKLFTVGAAIAAFGFVNAALAADMPVKAPVYKAPSPVLYNWSGCYIGGQVGYAWARDRDTETNSVTGVQTIFSPVDTASVNGPKAGGYLGCNWQTSAFVLGVEGDGEWAHLKGSANYINTGVPPDFYETTIRSQASVRGRVGYAAFDRTLLYVTGGVAFANVNEHDEVGGVGTSNDNSATRTGWTLGGGVDYAFTGNWIARIEYRYADFGKFSYNPPVFGAVTETHKITENAVRVGLAYKFW